MSRAYTRFTDSSTPARRTPLSLAVALAAARTAPPLVQRILTEPICCSSHVSGCTARPKSRLPSPLSCAVAAATPAASQPGLTPRSCVLRVPQRAPRHGCHGRFDSPFCFFFSSTSVHHNPLTSSPTRPPSLAVPSCLGSRHVRSAGGRPWGGRGLELGEFGFRRKRKARHLLPCQLFVLPCAHYPVARIRVPAVFMSCFAGCRSRV